MKTCSVCRLDVSEEVGVCPDCGTEFDGEADWETSEEVEERKDLVLGDVVLGRYCLKEVLTEGTYKAERTEGPVFVRVVESGAATNPLRLMKAREPLIRMNSPLLEKIIEARIEGGRAILVTEWIGELHLEDLFEEGDEAIAGVFSTSGFKGFVHSATKLVEILHRKHSLPGLDAGNWFLRDGRPVLSGALIARLRTLDESEREERSHRQRDMLQLLALFRRVGGALERVKGSKDVGFRGLLELFEAISRAKDDVPSASRLLVEVARVLAVGQKAPEKIARHENKGRGETAHRPLHQEIDRPESDLPSIASGAPNVTAKRQVYRGPTFTPDGLRKERARKRQEAMRRLRASRPRIQAGHRRSLGADLLFLNGLGWLIPIFGAGEAWQALAGVVLGGLGIPLLSRFCGKLAKPEASFFLLGGIGGALSLILGMGGAGLGWAIVLAMFSAYRSSLTAKLAAPDNSQFKEESNYVNEKRREAEAYLDQARLVLSGGAALSLAVLPGALGRDAFGAVVCLAGVVGALATHFGAKKSESKLSDPARTIPGYLMSGGVLVSCWAFLPYPPILAASLVLVLGVVLGFGRCVEAGAFGARFTPRESGADQESVVEERVVGTPVISVRESGRMVAPADLREASGNSKGIKVSPKKQRL